MRCDSYKDNYKNRVIGVDLNHAEETSTRRKTLMKKQTKKIKGLCKTCRCATAYYQGSNDGKPTTMWCTANGGRKLSKGYTVCPYYETKK